MKQKILVIDDDPFAILGVRKILEKKFTVVGLGSLANLTTMLKRHQPVLTILDLDLKEFGNGLDAISVIQQHDCKVLVLTTAFDHESRVACLRAQVNGFIPKKRRVELLLDSVIGALAGHNMTDPALIADVQQRAGKLPRIGWRLAELIGMVLAHPFLTNEALAKKMKCSPGHLAGMLHKLYVKFKVHKRHELLIELRRMGYRARDTSNPAATDAADTDAGGADAPVLPIRKAQ
jgi:DNA-binding NarL/FixJ family response regulator